MWLSDLQSKAKQNQIAFRLRKTVKRTAHHSQKQEP
jgi:hypothetical protein